MPLHKNNLLLKDLGDEFLVYSGEQKEIHVMNPTARLIWDLCDGTHTVESIAHEMRTHFEIPADRNIAGDIQATLEVFRSKGLLADEGELGYVESH